MQGAVIASPFYLEETGLIYVGSLGNEFIAIDANTHQVKWRYDGSIEKLSGIWAKPIYLQGQLIFNDDLGNIVSVDPKTGAENWVLIEQGKMLKTSAPLVGDIEEMVDHILELGYDTIFGVNITSGLSSTISTVSMVCEQKGVTYDYFDCWTTARVQLQCALKAVEMFNEQKKF